MEKTQLDELTALSASLADAIGSLQLVQKRLCLMLTDMEGPRPQPPPVHSVANILPKHRNGKYATRSMDSVTALVIHHSAGNPKATPTAIAKYHVESRQWPGIGYHYYIGPDGTVWSTNEWETLSWHTYGHNDYTLGICLAGLFMGGHVPPEPQLEAARQLVRWLMHELSIPPERVYGHQELNETACPGDTWDEWGPRLL